MSKIRLGFAKPMSPQDSQRRLSSGILLVRILVGWVFLSEGIQKLLFPAALGAGRFLKIDIPAPQITGPFVGVVEIVCGTLLIVGLFTILATVPLFIDIVVAIATTKVQMLLKQGFWAAMHEARTDFCMLVGLIAIALLGAGALSLDERRRRTG
jgi:putative oxidoreductase